MNIAETKFTKVELDGETWGIIILHKDWGQNPNLKSMVSDQVWKALGENDHLLTGVYHDDGTLGLAADLAFAERILAKIGPDHQWSKVRFYP